MYLTLARCFLRIIPIIYMIWIWLQSSYFNPGSLEYILSELSYKVVLVIGGSLELAHLFQFALLYFFLVMALLTYGELNTKKEYIALAITLSYAVLDEIHQYFIPYRSFTFIDIAKNVSGIWLMWLMIRTKYYKRENSKFGLFLKGITNKYRQS